MRLRVAAFPSAGELALYVADARGLFGAAGLAVEINDVRGSRHQFEGLAEGRWDVVHTAADNVLARRDIVIVLGVNRGLLSLVSAPRVSAIGELRGRPVGVDSASSGFAVVLRHLLEREGVSGCELVEVGGTRERARALAAGEIAATLLTPPYDVEALQRGCRRLARPTDHVPRYLGATVAVPPDWAARHRDPLARYLRATLAAHAWLRDPGNRTAALAIVRERTSVGEDLAPAVLDAVLDPSSGLLPDVEPADVEAVIAVRRLDGLLVSAGAAEYLDLSYLADARRAASTMPA